MTEITAGDFQEWKTNKVTKAFFYSAQERIEDTKDFLASSAGIDPTQDRFFVGLIHAYREMQDFRVDE